ncbi:RNA polymerase sigma factor [Aureibaculum sp. 2210JD6-5]|uniref:RNA polymerase sigma factor n=1 Tax=Aureibaculum sp. 2210JD6-5 TaxID=3103957 RepID=UPI002AAE6E51|nr:RNA polymerase sigma factor [Aureibaculum sp. 2210JD6-5]MDY7396519.1 RNA polymerase sigma factor [Aureibaculum sp. 2210JD6-5]
MKIISLYTNEKQLIKKAASANRQAQQALYEKYAPKMLSVCRQYIKDLQFAEDVMINGFVKVFKYLSSFRHEGSFEGWIRKIMIRESISYLRKQQFVVYDDEVFERNDDLGTLQSSELDVAHIQLLIDALPTGYKTVFILNTVEGYKHQEIAKMLDITESTSKSQLYKARKMLQEKLKQQKIIGYGTK